MRLRSRIYPPAKIFNLAIGIPKCDLAVEVEVLRRMLQKTNTTGVATDSRDNIKIFLITPNLPPVLCKGVFCYINLIFYAIKILNMKITESNYMKYAVIPDLRKEIMQCICSIKQVDALSFAKQIDKKFSESICLFVHTIVIGETVYVIDSKGNNLVEIDTTEMVTNCCSASMVDETDICSACKEHASLVPAET